MGAEQPHEAAHGREAVQVHLAQLPLFFPHSLCHEGPLQDSHRCGTPSSPGPWERAEVRMVKAERERVLPCQLGKPLHFWRVPASASSPRPAAAGAGAEPWTEIGGLTHSGHLSCWDDHSNTTRCFSEVKRTWKYPSS